MLSPIEVLVIKAESGQKAVCTGIHTHLNILLSNATQVFILSDDYWKCLLYDFKSEERTHLTTCPAHTRGHSLRQKKI